MKFEHYRRLESLVEYVLVAQDEPRVESFVQRPDQGWLFTATAGLEAAVTFPSIDCRVELAEIYDKVPLPAS